ncbi:protein phosphatase 2C domain-containing protein [Iningainema tapete]|uniref:Protein phosphatase 2C domain-containing protein n=1 Tax=Iningainema tapete BLCC-T55 TaxID=2748662 RepID=A0A8J6XSF0_9CYAN|nr:protein phosphatase 2C domain-containing protein [Iningainema tapete BLCC-T55]
MVWKAIARSSIGISHKKQQIPCQDYGEYRILKNVIVGAVADGAGSAKFADIGAKLAVKTALSYLWEFQKDKPYWQERCRPRSEQPVRKMFAKAVNKVVTALQTEAANGGYSFQDLACTLLVFVATPHWVAAMQIGDGFIVVCSQQGNHQLLFPPDKGEFINETTFVTSANALSEMQVCVLPGKQKFICASTDGLERVAIHMSNWTPFPPFFKPLEEYLWESSNPEQEDEYIRNFLESDKLNARTNDDKTLLLCLYNR